MITCRYRPQLGKSRERGLNWSSESRHWSAEIKTVLRAVRQYAQKSFGPGRPGTRQTRRFNCHWLKFVSCWQSRVLLANVNSCSCSLYVVVRPSVCRLSVVCLSVTFVHPIQRIEIFGNVSAPFNTLVTWRHPGEILWRSSQVNPSVGGLNQRVLEKCSDFGPFRGYISETVQDRR